MGFHGRNPTLQSKKVEIENLPSLNVVSYGAAQMGTLHLLVNAGMLSAWC